ncbi:hypothetical protein DER46DRAFT_567094 [Fusarium sp. MPI-SDFR-AT-0072]|nr:hypothetical protein DER46DRAFT_567094 [Fusarium sp. MPI-SDFR-AT-0072]
MPNCSFCGILRDSFRVRPVVSDRPQRMFSTCPYRTAPDPGYDSVEAVLFRDGGIVNYPETVVYRYDAIVPVTVIMYERFNWVIFHNTMAMGDLIQMELLLWEFRRQLCYVIG